MSLFKQITDDWKTALKAKSPDKETLSAIRAELQSRAKNDNLPELNDDTAISVIGKMSQVLSESIAFAKQAARDDLISEGELKLSVVKRYLPSMLTDDELNVVIAASISEAGATAAKDFGKVMKILVPKIKGRADGSKVQGLVKSLLP